MDKERNKLTRIGEEFNNEIEDIKQKRKQLEKDKVNVSTKKITNLIIKHSAWRQIKEDTIKYIFPRNSHGFVTVQMFIMFFLAFISIVLLGIAYFTVSTITNNLMIDVNIGQVNLMNATNETLGQINRGFQSNVDNLGLAIILGMILAMMLNGYFLGKKYHRLFIVLDIFILIFVFIFTVYLSQAYDLLINATSELTVYKDYLPKSSLFFLHLPWYVAIIGIIIIIISYLNIPKQQNEVVDNVFVY